MLDWIMKRRPARRGLLADGADQSKRLGWVATGKYQPLYHYLERRYADTVVLTFAEIEDLIGFALPDPARLDRQWWVEAGADAGDARSHSDSWILASRTASPDLAAKTVVFERRNRT